MPLVRRGVVHHVEGIGQHARAHAAFEFAGGRGAAASRRRLTAGATAPGSAPGVRARICAPASPSNSIGPVYSSPLGACVRATMLRAISVMPRDISASLGMRAISSAWNGYAVANVHAVGAPARSPAPGERLRSQAREPRCPRNSRCSSRRCSHPDRPPSRRSRGNWRRRPRASAPGWSMRLHPRPAGETARRSAPVRRARNR